MVSDDFMNIWTQVAECKSCHQVELYFLQEQYPIQYLATQDDGSLQLCSAEYDQFFP